MKIRSVTANNRKKTYEVRTSTKRFVFPYAKVDPQPTADDPVMRVLDRKSVV